eukprot:TRINITY_DN558_c1_g1_i11.p3 TRINITY_DN558_c1_g1~~TRINITY_DN558_c1_g1_i11.p3  ORF type:complete len:184 (-),score=10.90 TRINITY_DN558_c1_g1_i11:459-1010(-)
MNKTNSILQEHDISNYTASLQIEILMDNFETNYKKELPNIVNGVMGELETGTYQGMDITLQVNTKETCIMFAQEITELLIKFLKERFPDKAFIKNFKSLELNSASEANLTPTYGNGQLKETMKRFERCANAIWPPNQIKFQELTTEWLGVKMFAQKLKRDGVTDVEPFINLECRDLYQTTSSQ